MGMFIESNGEVRDDREFRPLFAGRIDLVSGSLWSSAVEQFRDIPNGKKVLAKWTVNNNNDRLAIYTLEKRINQWERWIRVWNVDQYPTDWDYVYCDKTPNEVNLQDYNRDLVCSSCYDIYDF